MPFVQKKLPKIWQRPLNFFRKKQEIATSFSENGKNIWREENGTNMPLA